MIKASSAFALDAFQTFEAAVFNNLYHGICKFI